MAGLLGKELSSVPSERWPPTDSITQNSTFRVRHEMYQSYISVQSLKSLSCVSGTMFRHSIYAPFTHLF